jgi:sterol desaturase/sphingolipid hydroxylase (fatty acid hydroxylase superfamily)
MPFLAMLGVVLAVSGGSMALLTRLARTPYGIDHAIRSSKNHAIAAAKYRRTVVFNGTFSFLAVVVPAVALERWLFTGSSAGPLRCLGEASAILLVYDFVYYLLHRYPFHQWGALKRVHAVHHTAKNPIALDSLYMHPIENALGLALLWGSVCAVRAAGGPLSPYAFVGMFLVYSILNVVVHAGLDPKSPLMFLFTSFATRHNKHHESMQGKNYASVTPLWDMVFGTEEP